MRIIVAALGAALLVAACGSAATPPAGGQSSTAPLASPGGPSASGGFALPSVVAASGSAAAVLGSIEQYLQQRAGSSATPPAWTSEIIGATVNGSTLVIKTDLASRTTDATDMCTALSSAVMAGASSLGVTGLEIDGSGGQALVTKSSASGSC